MFKRVQDWAIQALQPLTAKLRQLVPTKPLVQNNPKDIEPSLPSEGKRFQEYHAKLKQINLDFPQKSTSYIETLEAQKIANQEIKNKIFVNQILSISINADTTNRDKENSKKEQKSSKSYP